MINANFYDIESLRNLFTLANFKDAEDPRDTVLDIYFLCDDEARLLCEPNWQDRARDRIYMRNLNFEGRIRFLNLRNETAARNLASTFGLSDARFMNDPDAPSSYPPEFRITCDTDPDYDPDRHPYFFGYNSYNYDTTMLAWYFQHTWLVKPLQPGQQVQRQMTPCIGQQMTKGVECSFCPSVTANEIRDFNNLLFEPGNKSAMPSVLAKPDRGRRPDYSRNGWKIRKNMIMSGRHLDVARLNEKQSKVGLKRLLGMLGFQILESDKLDIGNDTIMTPDQFYDLIAYNASDVINLKQLFYHRQYQAQFDLKKQMLLTYPELVYEKQRTKYAPDVSPRTVRSDRLTIDSSSAQFATKSLCPYGHLRDIETVSFMYPHPEQARQMGITPVNVLDEARAFFHRLYPQQELRDQFEVIYQYYKSIEGKNFNESETYNEDYTYQEDDGTIHQPIPALKLAEVPKADTCMPYFDKDGNPTSCFVLFSTGGIHGAEYNVRRYEHDRNQWLAAMADMEEAKRQFPNPVDLRKAKKITMADGRVLKYDMFLKSGLKIDDSQYRDLSEKEPLLFKAGKKGGTELNKKYVYTSTCKANHEDFTSYYPNLLRRMQAFFNTGLGYDRYAEIFQQKQDYGKLMKDKSLDPKERDMYKVLREGTKLVLNSASGAADATFENNIRVNNQIISMRIIGQLFSWRIGQAQSYEGATVPSTNTDGLYSVMEEDLNNAILERESADIGVEIEPEPLYLISKDSNNRVELSLKTGDIISASGGTLGCRRGPDPTKALSHPAIIDWALTEYLIVTSQNYKGLRMDGPFDETIGRNILLSAFSKFEPVRLLTMYQNIIASSPGSVTYVYGMRDNQPDPIPLQHYNRIFIMKDGTPDTMHLWAAAARAITPAMRKKREKNNERNPAAPEPNAAAVLKANGETEEFPDKDVVTKKVTNLDPEWCIRIENHDLNFLTPDQRQEILDGLAIDKYLLLLCNAYTNNWMNKIPGTASDVPDAPETDDGEDAELAG